MFDFMLMMKPWLSTVLLPQGIAVWKEAALHQRYAGSRPVCFRILFTFLHKHLCFPLWSENTLLVINNPLYTKTQVTSWTVFIVLSFPLVPRTECNNILTVAALNASSLWEKNNEEHAKFWASRSHEFVSWSARASDPNPWVELQLSDKSSVSGRNLQIRI